MSARFRRLALSFAAAAAALAGAAGLAGPALASSGEEPLARFDDPLCPGVAGLKRDAAEVMVRRIRDNAEALGLRMAPDGACTANLVIAFVADGQAHLRRLEASDRRAFEHMRLADRRALLNSPGPVRVFQRIVPRSRDGEPIARNENLVDVPQTRMWMAHSKIYTATRNDMYYSLVLIDRDEIDGLGVGQLADYATFVGLSPILPKAYDDSILALFGGAAARPTALSEFDRAYLAALYEGVPNLPRPAGLARLEAATGRDIFE